MNRSPASASESLLRFLSGSLKAVAGWVGIGVALAMLGGAPARGQSPTPGGKGAGPRSTPIARVEIAIPNHAAIDRLVQGGYDIARVQTDLALVYADPEELANLRSEGWKLRLLEPDVTGPVSSKTLGSYNSYADLTAMLDGYATNFPALCRKVSIGKSVRNRDLWALKITRDPDAASDKPKCRYLSTFHGNEPLGTEMCLYFIDLLLNAYGSNDVRVVNLVDQVEIWILPLANPDGRETSTPQRYNANYLDLNRCFPEGSNTNLGNRLFGPNPRTNGLQPEVRAIIAWTTNHNFTLGANLHTGSLLVNYPYDNDQLGNTYSPSPDDALFLAMSRSYASNNPPMWDNTTPYGPFTNGVVNGADWYVISGGLQDWSYRYAGSLEVTIELSNEQWPYPPAAELPVYWAQNREAMLTYFEWALRGVRGVLHDAVTGQPIHGAIRTEGFHHLVFSDPAAGDYHRVLLPGTYTLWFYAPGYVPQRIRDVVVAGGPATRLDVALQPVSSRFAAAINFQPATTPIPAGYRTDSGAVYGSRGDGYIYGWENTLPGANMIERKAGRSQDTRYDTFAQMQAGGSHTWEIAVPNGPYSVLVAAGDPAWANGWCRILAENAPLIDAAPTAADRWLEGLDTVVVTDGRLTLSNGSEAISNRLAFVEISALEPATLPQWRARWFATTDNSGNAANDADPDMDGLANLWEYAFGLNPTAFDSDCQPIARLAASNNLEWLECSFSLNRNASDLLLTLQVSDSLVPSTWSPLASCTNGTWSGTGTVSENLEAPGRSRVTVRDSDPVSASASRYLRLELRCGSLTSDKCN